MSVWAITMVRDEADVIEETLGRMLPRVDRVLVADNGSTDGTREILDRLDVDVVDDQERGYYQSRKMTALAEIAREQGAEWIVPFDADEVWLAHAWSITATLADLPAAARVVQARVFDHMATGADPDDSPVASMGWRRNQQLPLPKVACRALPGLVIHQGNHGASYPDVPHPLAATGLLEVRHFPYRSVEQFLRKVRNGAAAYAATDLPDDHGAHWRSWGHILDQHGEDAVAEIFRTWYFREDPTTAVEIGGERLPALVFDPCPA